MRRMRMRHSDAQIGRTGSGTSRNAGVAQSLQHLCGCDHLADMTLGMIGHMDKGSAEAGGQLLAADGARRVEVGRT